MIEQSRGNLVEAEKLYRQSLEIKQRIGDQPGAALSYGQLGHLAETRKQLNLAKEYFEKALEIFSKIGDKPHTNQAKEDLTRILRKLKQQ
jgi:tetratricopeptide (TPR) repeat protein